MIGFDSDGNLLLFFSKMEKEKVLTIVGTFLYHIKLNS